MSADLVSALTRKISSYREELLELSARLISHPTENPPGRSYGPCAEMIGDELVIAGLEAEVLKVPGAEREEEPRYCVLASYGGGERALYFHGHYDVVPAFEAAQFEPRVAGGKLHGRGSADMKGGIAAMIYAVKALVECGVELGGRIGITVVPDEETGGRLGSGYLLEAGILGRDGVGMLTPEPTGGVIWNASRGAVSMQVRVRGAGAHVGLSYKGVNAFERMLDVAGKLRDLRIEIESRRTKYNISPAAARASILLLGGINKGGSGFNVVPDSSSFTVDRRTNPEEQLDAEKGRIIEILEEARKGGIELDYEILQESGSSALSENHALASALAESASAVTGVSPRFEMCPGLLETRFYAAAGVPALAYGPGSLSVAHGPRECVRVDDLCACAAVYALAASKILGV